MERLKELRGKVATLMIAFRVAQRGGLVTTGANRAVPGRLETGTERDKASKFPLEESNESDSKVLMDRNTASLKMKPSEVWKEVSWDDLIYSTYLSRDPATCLASHGG